MAEEFEVGDLVIATSDISHKPPYMSVKKGDVLTLREIVVLPSNNGKFWRFRELTNQPYDYPSPVGTMELLYNPSCFALHAKGPAKSFYAIFDYSDIAKRVGRNLDWGSL